MTATRLAGPRRRTRAGPAFPPPSDQRPAAHGRRGVLADRRPACPSRADRRPAAHERRGMQSDVVLDLGWGRLVFGHTFDDLRGVLDALRAEETGRRDICVYPRDPQVLVGLAPDELFLDPSL